MVWKRQVLAALAVAAALLALPAVASAADTFADAGAPDNSGDCLTPETACQTISGVDGALSKSGTGDTTFVADGTYLETVLLGDGKSLRSLDATDPKPVIDGGAGGSAIDIDPSGAGTVSGFELLSEVHPLNVDGTVTVLGNRFASPVTSSGAQIAIEGAASVVIDENDFVDPNADGPDSAITTITPDGVGPQISDNTFSDFAAAVAVVAGQPQITDNQFSGSRPVGATAFGFIPGAGVAVIGGTPTIARNTVASPDVGPSAGVFVLGVYPVTPSGADLRRNRISGTDAGVQVVDGTAPVTLSNDLLYDNGVGLEAVDSTAPFTDGDISATNATIYGNTVDVRLDNTTLTMDSSIVETPIDLVGGNGDCAITYSRGPEDPVANGCDDFDTDAAPDFVDAPGGDFHLQPDSPLIDVGNPTDPGLGAVDFYGAPRRVQGAPCNALVRDIGAAEFQPGSPPLCAQNTYADVSGGDDENDCTSLATACETIAGALAKMGPGQTTLVADGTYPEALTLQDGRSLVAMDAPYPRPIIDSGVAANGTAVTVEDSGTLVSGFRIRSDNMPMLLQDATAEVADNVFDEESDTSEAMLLAISGGSGNSVHDNVFIDPGADSPVMGVALIENDTEAEILDNTFTDLSLGVVISTGSAEITGNQISGDRPFGSGLPGFPGAGVLVIEGDAVIEQNTIRDPSGHPSAGVYVRQVSAVDPATASLSHNRINGNDIGVGAVDSAGVELSNDLVYDNTVGVESADSGADNPTPSTQGDFSATNATIFDNAVDLQLSFTTATLNSTLLSVPVDFVGDGGCAITYSRGPATGSVNGCGDFATSADPQFVDAAAGDYRLQSSSALIDAGDPLSPGPGALDFYGSPRELQGKACSTVRRDIGAAEYDPGTTPQCMPATPPAPAPAPDPEPADTRPERPQIDERPERRSEERTATFNFSSSSDGAGFRCRIDSKAWKSCEPPVTYRKLKYGKHRFRVQAVSEGGRRSEVRTVKFWVLRPE